MAKFLMQDGKLVLNNIAPKDKRAMYGLTMKNTKLIIVVIFFVLEFSVS